MKKIFLSASVPKRGRGDFDETSDPFLIQFAVRELVALCLGRRQIVWGGHPSITPMVHAVCREFGADYDAPVLLYQSAFYADRFPISNQFFDPIVVDAQETESASLSALRRRMLDQDLSAAIFIGGMDGILEEHGLYKERHGRDAPALALAAPGGAARRLAAHLNNPEHSGRLDFTRLFQEVLRIEPGEPRQLRRRVVPRG